MATTGDANSGSNTGPASARVPFATGRQIVGQVVDRLQPVLILVAILILMSVLSPGFLTANNLLTIGLQGTTPAVLAIGVTLVIISGGIDLSIGTVMSLTMVVMGGLVINAGLPLWLGISAAQLTGALVGVMRVAAP